MKTADGNFYGVTSDGGQYHAGTIFRLSVPLPPVLRSTAQSVDTLTLTWSAVAGQSYQVQYNSDLSSTNWNELGSAVTATNGIMSVSDGIGPDLQRFYRVVCLP